MRVLTIAVVAMGLSVAGCSRADTAPAPRDQNAAAPKSLVPTGTAGTTDAPRPASEPIRAAAKTAASTVPEVRPAAAEAWREVTIPAGTTLPLVLDTGVGSDISRVEQPVQAHLARAIVIRGETALAQGSAVSGVVTDAKRSGKVKGRAHVAVRFDTITPRGVDERYRIRTASIGRLAPATKKKDALEIGVPAAGGAVIGALVGGKKGAAIGGAAGGGAGTAVVLSTRGKEVHLPRGSLLSVRLTEPITVKVRG